MGSPESVATRIIPRFGPRSASPREISGDDFLEACNDFRLALEVLDQPHYEQFDDFLEMVIEFGYVTLFASAFPLAAVVSLVSNLIELKSDMFKLACVYQRPISHRMKSIGLLAKGIKRVVPSVGKNV
eukprot:g3961.t1